MGEDSNAEGGQHTDPGLLEHNCISSSLSTVFLPYGQMYFFQKREGKTVTNAESGQHSDPGVLKHEIENRQQ